MLEVVVYKLIDPRNNKVKYIGISGCVVQRFKQHTTKCFVEKASNRHYVNWMRQINYSPVFKVVCRSSSRAAAEKQEARLIKHYRNSVVNIRDYGNTSAHYDNQIRGIRAAWEDGRMNWNFEAKHLEHLRQIRTARQYYILCSHTDGRSQTVFGLNEAVKFTGIKSKGCICAFLKNTHKRKTDSIYGWKFKRIST